MKRDSLGKVSDSLFYLFWIFTNLNIINCDFSTTWMYQPNNSVEKSGFTCTIWTDYGKGLSLFDIERNSYKGFYILIILNLLQFERDSLTDMGRLTPQDLTQEEPFLQTQVLLTLDFLKKL